MGYGYGPRSLGSNAGDFQVIADGLPEHPTGGWTIDWTTVPANSAEVELKDGNVIPSGTKYLRYGTALALIATPEVQTVDLSGGNDPTGGTWTATLNYTDGTSATTGDIAFDASAAVVEEELRKLVHGAGLTVTKAGFVYTVTFPREAGANIPALVIDSSALTGAGLTMTVTTTTAGVGSGLYGPVDTGATDGRQTLSRGRLIVLNRTVREDEEKSMYAGAAITGGRVFADRLLVGVGTAPTMANLLAALTRLEPVYG
jgi:hypothetical protein